MQVMGIQWRWWGCKSKHARRLIRLEVQTDTSLCPTPVQREFRQRSCRYAEEEKRGRLKGSRTAKHQCRVSLGPEAQRRSAQCRTARDGQPAEADVGLPSPREKRMPLKSRFALSSSSSSVKSL